RMPSTADTRVDLHFHVLPGVDDGPATLEQSLRIADLAVRDGTRLAVVTPHVRSDHLLGVDQLHERVRRRARIRRAAHYAPDDYRGGPAASTTRRGLTRSRPTAPSGLGASRSYAAGI
ncbi:MAG: CpsB/CapC family capsule biosynthesis tyrosine phosphatase, partial [Solirubrobacteraceae bacterium]